MLLAWLPVMAAAVAFVLWLAVGVVHLEARTYGSEVFISNQGSVDGFKLAMDNRAEARAENAVATY